MGRGGRQSRYRPVRESRNQNGCEQECPEDGVSDEDKTSRIPARVEWEKGADTVVVGPVEQDVAETGDEGRKVEPAPANLLRLELCGDRCAGWKGESRYGVQAAALGIEVNEGDNADDGGCHERCADECVGDAAMVLEASRWDRRTTRGYRCPEPRRPGRSQGCSTAVVLRLRPARPMQAPVRKWVTGSHRGIVTRVRRAWKGARGQHGTRYLRERRAFEWLPGALL